MTPATNTANNAANNAAAIIPAASAECRCLLDDGRVLTVRASRRPRANRAEVKCTLPGQPALSERVQEVVRLARHTEALYDSRLQVVLSLDPLPAAHQREWELAAVLADRMVRGLFQPSLPLVYAAGFSDQWQLGRIDGAGASARARLAQHVHRIVAPPCLLILGGPAATAADHVNADDADQDNPAEQHQWLTISHLGGLHGHPDPGATVAASRAWFPLHSGGLHDCLSWVEVSVRPLQHIAEFAPNFAANAATEEEESSITVLGLDLTQQLAVRQVLMAARQFDPKGEGRWRTVVRFGPGRFHGDSYQLALVMADRIARGRDFAARGRLIASGCSSAWHSGLVQTVAGCGPKSTLILAQAQAGDRVLLPKAWQTDLPDGYAAALKGKGASLACIARIGFF
jgi:hypothetical protein